MAKKSGSKRVLIPHRMGNGKWQVSLGVDKAEDGSRKWKRRQFSTREAAQDFCTAERARQRAHGSLTAETDGALVAQWLALDEELREAGAGSLLEAGKRVLRDLRAIRRTGSAKDCLDAFLRTRSPGIYTDDLRNRCGRFVVWFGSDRKMAEATREVMTAYWENSPGATDRRTISAWMGWAADPEEGGWLPINPCTRRRRKGVREKRSQAVILTPSASAQLLRAAVTTEDWVTLSFLVFGLFAGVRPMEFTKKFKDKPRLFWSWDCIKGEHALMPDEMAKGGVGRVMPMNSTLRTWLDFLREKRGILSGPMLAVGTRNGGWRKHWEAFLAAHWPHEWDNDQLRHSFGSYTLAHTRNADATSLVMGNSRSVLLKHYWNWETLASEADAFFALTPETVCGKYTKITVAKSA